MTVLDDLEDNFEAFADILFNKRLFFSLVDLANFLFIFLFRLRLTSVGCESVGDLRQRIINITSINQDFQRKMPEIKIQITWHFKYKYPVKLIASF